MAKRYIFIMGGGLSGLGKGIASASIGSLLKEHGYRVSFKKADVYLNTDPGTQNPIEHGEVYVTDGGLETDLDLGSYYRFTGCEFDEHASITSGKVYQEIITQERLGAYLGRTVQIIPHVTNLLQEKFTDKTTSDICLIEVGGTIEDIESQPFVEAARQFANRVGRDHVLFVHVAYVPYLKTTKELKTKLVQQTVRNLRAQGIIPDILMCRTERTLPRELKQKLATMCDVPLESIFEGRDVESIYDVPINLYHQHLDDLILKRFGLLHRPEMTMDTWRLYSRALKHAQREVRVAIVGKYVQLEDAYASVVESLKHAGASLNARVHLTWIQAETLEEPEAAGYTEAWQALREAQAVIVPGGFGNRGMQGMVLAAEYARTHRVPYLGICLGMQVAVIEYAQHVLGIATATSQEFDEDGQGYHVVHLMAHQYGQATMGGTMRLGAYTCVLADDSLLAATYEATVISRRHRHRYELNPRDLPNLHAHGLHVVGHHPESGLAEAVELDTAQHPYYVGVQYHPEFSSRLVKPEPLFVGLLRAVLGT